MATMSGQSSRDGNFKEHGRRTHHDNAGYDLRTTISQKRVNKFAKQLTVSSTGGSPTTSLCAFFSLKARLLLLQAELAH